MTDGYISRQAAIEDFTAWQKDLAYGFGEEYSGVALLKTAVTVIEHYPAADVVEVVRCKDCKHKPNGYTDDDVLRYPNFPHEENNPCPCQVYEDEWYSWIPNDDFYCSYGEREEE